MTSFSNSVGLVWVRLTLFAWILIPLPVVADEPAQMQSERLDRQNEEQPLPEDEEKMMEEADYPDLLGIDEKGEVMDEFALLQEQETVELPSRHRQEIGMSPSAVTLLTREDIESSGATTIPDLLRLVPGMDVIVMSSAYTAIGARLIWAFDNTYHQVLIDGRNVRNPILGMPLWEIEGINIEEIERIEIIRGPASSLYGSNAFSGVVSMTTIPVPQGTSGWARFSGSTLGATSFSGRASTKLSDWDFLLSLGASHAGKTDDIRETSKRWSKIRSLVSYHWSQTGRVSLEASTTGGNGQVAFVLSPVHAECRAVDLHLSFEEENFRGHLTWNYSTGEVKMQSPLEYRQILLAEFAPMIFQSYSADGDIQWTLPRFFDPLLLIIGGGAQFLWIDSGQLLNAKTFIDKNSPRYHEPGNTFLNGGAFGFIHSELQLSERMTITAGARFDSVLENPSFLSPRLAAVIRPVHGHFLRLGVARAFRRPGFIETDAHLMAEFPAESPITGSARDQFQEFLTRVGGGNVDNEELLSFEVGYLGNFFKNRFTIGLDLYFNRFSNIVYFLSHIVKDAQGLPSLGESSVMSVNFNKDLEIFGSELSLRYQVSKWWTLSAAWAHREVKGEGDHSPKNLFSLGAKFSSPFDLKGSLYVFSRSEFWITPIANPEGLLAPPLEVHSDQDFLILGKLGWNIKTSSFLELEAGTQLFIPLSVSDSISFSYYESGGGMTPSGRAFGGDPLRYTATFYLQGSF